MEDTPQPLSTKEQRIVNIALDTVRNIGSGGGCPDCGHDATAIKRFLAKQQCATFYTDVDGIGDVVDCYCIHAHHTDVVRRFQDRPEIDA